MGVRSVVAAEGSDTTRRILAAASEEFAQRGYAGARVRQIVHAAVSVLGQCLVYLFSRGPSTASIPSSRAPK